MKLFIIENFKYLQKKREQFNKLPGTCYQTETTLGLALPLTREELCSISEYPGLNYRSPTSHNEATEPGETSLVHQSHS